MLRLTSTARMTAFSLTRSGRRRRGFVAARAKRRRPRAKRAGGSQGRGSLASRAASRRRGRRGCGRTAPGLLR